LSLKGLRESGLAKLLQKNMRLASASVNLQNSF